MSSHWTGRSIDDFVYRISSDFALQIENKMDEENITQSHLAEKIGVTPGRVSQVLRDPGNLTLKKMVEYARSLGMKVSIVAYEDDDPGNETGPINSQIFTACWAKAGRPNDFFSLTQSSGVIRNATTLFDYVEFTYAVYENRFTLDTQFTDLTWQQRTTTSKSLIAARA